MQAKKNELLSRSDALSSGSKHYFTGVACKRGHLAPRRVSSNDCVECGKLRQQDAKALEYKRNHYQKNKEHYIEKSKINYEKNREKCIQRAVDYQRLNMKHVYQRNKENIKKKLEYEPWFTIHLRLKAGLSSALRRAGSAKNKSKTMDAVGCSRDELKIHIEKQFLPGMSWSNRDKWHIDHIVPISTAKNEREVFELYHFTNLRPLWAADNIRKSNTETHLI